jgi:tetratricopeptide (TPR) repeat protein
VVVVAVSVALAAAAAYVTFGSRRSDDPDRLWSEAQAALRQDRIDEAGRLLDRIAAARPPEPQDWLLRGQLEVAREHSDEAVAALAEIPDSSQYAPTARQLAGQIELRRDRARFAEILLREAIRLDPGMVQARRELIYILGMQLRRQELNEEFAALSRVTTLQYDNLFHWGLMRSCLWEPGEVAQTLGRYLEADPDDRESRLALADNDRRLGLYDEAEEILAPMPADDPRALALRVNILMDRQQEDQAEELLKQGPPDDPELARLRGRSALARRDGEAALRFYKIAYDHEPANRDAVFGLIHAYELVGQPAKAVPLRREAEALEAFNSLIQRMSTPDGRGDPAIIDKAARACARAGFIPEARAWLNLAIARDPLNSAAQQALFRFNEQHPPDPRDDHVKR